MANFYSFKDQCFYNSTISPNKVIKESYELSDSLYRSLVDGVSSGKVIAEGPSGEPVLSERVIDPVEPSLDEIKAEFELATQNFMDGKAKAAGYDSLLTAISYAEEPAVPKFQAEGKAFRAWRSVVWAHANEQLAMVLSGATAQPTIEAFLQGLPPLELSE